MKCQNDRETGVLLAERAAQAGTARLIYRLECRKGCWMSVSSDAETERIFLGSDLEIAWSFFCAAVRGTVTPCVLEEVFCDWFAIQQPAK